MVFIHLLNKSSHRNYVFFRDYLCRVKKVTHIKLLMNESPEISHTLQFYPYFTFLLKVGIIKKNFLNFIKETEEI